LRKKSKEKLSPPSSNDEEALAMKQNYHLPVIYIWKNADKS